MILRFLSFLKHNTIGRWCCVLFLMLSFFRTHAQGENNNWCFGWHIRMDFNANPPLLLKDSMIDLYGPAAVSDAGGNLLFYTNGLIVWNKNNDTMPNGGIPLLSGNPSVNSIGLIHKGVTIIRSPSNNNQYYIIAADGFSAPTSNIYYTIVDMALNNGLGDVVASQRNIPFASDMNATVQIVKVANNCNAYWIILHEVRGARYAAYKLDINGISPTPIWTNSNLIPNTILSFYTAKFKMNHTGNRVAFVLQDLSDKIETAEFNNTTGSFFNFNLVQGDSVFFGYDFPTFSPDDSKLYIAANKLDSIAYYLLQFDMSLLPNLQNVQNSRTVVCHDNDTFPTAILDTRTAPNGKIYCSSLFNDHMFVINNPNLQGALCDFDNTGIAISGNIIHGYNAWFNNPIGDFGNPVIINPPADTIYQTPFARDTSVCATSITLTADTSYQYQLWSTHSTAPQETFTQDGTYWLRGIKNCTAYVDSFRIHFIHDTIVHSRLDTVICESRQVSIITNSQYQSVLWSDGSVNATKTFTQPGLYWVYGFKDCHTYIDSFYLKNVDVLFSLGNDTAICAGQSILLNATPDGTFNNIQYLWQNGSIQPTYIANTDGIYKVAVTADGCTVADSITINIIHSTLEILEHDTMLCIGVPITLHAQLSPLGNYYWNTGSNQSTTLTQGAGIYALLAVNICGTYKDSISIQEKKCCNDPFIPNAFSPNGDGLNDVFELKFYCPQSSGFQLNIYNRYGQMIFNTDNPEGKWNGDYLTKPCDQDTYFYMLRYYDGNNEVTQKGDLILLR